MHEPTNNLKLQKQLVNHTGVHVGRKRRDNWPLSENHIHVIKVMNCAFATCSTMAELSFSAMHLCLRLFHLLYKIVHGLSYTFFFVINNFFYFFHTQHNTISKIKQNKTADTYSSSQGSIKREGEREGQQEHKSYSFK